MIARIGPVQSTSSVDFFGIAIVGDCAIDISSILDHLWCESNVAVIKPLTPTMSFLTGTLAGAVLAGGVRSYIYKC